jgi:hypothetical protein
MILFNHISYAASNGTKLMTDKLETIRLEDVMAYFNYLTQCFPGRIEENSEIPESRLQISGSDSNPEFPNTKQEC